MNIRATGGIAIGTAALVAGLAAAASAANDDAGIRAVRQHTKQYHDEAAALADGFIPTDECVPGMGYHYVNPQRLDDRLELTRPEVLLYGPSPDGGRRLLGAEWVVVDDDGDVSTDHDRPQVFGHEFQGPMEGHVPGMPVHYDLHAYAWADNPNGAFSPVNPTITCPGR